jgi:hypothetical protein
MSKSDEREHRVASTCEAAAAAAAGAAVAILKPSQSRGCELNQQNCFDCDSRALSFTLFLLSLVSFSLSLSSKTHAKKEDFFSKTGNVSSGVN